jgi:hypothetical protein
MTEAELREKHAIRVAWSNSGGTLDQLLSGAFYNSLNLGVLSDFASVMGIEMVERKWRELSESRGRQNDFETISIKPYVEEILTRIKNGQHQITPEYRRAMAEIAKRKPAGELAPNRWHGARFANRTSN